jgi:hypothetical protein
LYGRRCDELHEPIQASGLKPNDQAQSRGTAHLQSSQSPCPPRALLRGYELNCSYRIIELQIFDNVLWYLSQRIGSRLFGIERSSKAKIAHDVKNKIVQALSEVQRLRPLRRAIVLFEQDLVPTVDMLADESRDSHHRLVCKASVEHLASVCVFRGIYAVQSRLLTDIFGQAHVEGAPANIGLHAVDGRMRLRVAEKNKIGRNADLLAIDLEELP